MKRVLLLILCSVMAGQLYAANLKIGVVNMDQVIQKSPLALSINDKLSHDFSPRQDAINAAQKKLQDDANQLTFNGYKLSATERSTLQDAITSDKRDLDALTTAFQKDLASEQAQYTKQLMASLNKLIGQIAKDEHFDMIQTSVNIMFLNNTLDLTPEIISKLK